MKSILLIFFPLTMFSQTYETQKYTLIDKSSYNWKPLENKKYTIDVFNIQYVRNLNPRIKKDCYK